MSRVTSAFVAALITLVLGGFLLGMTLTSEGINLVVEASSTGKITFLFVGVALVFLLQLFREQVGNFTAKMRSDERMELPSFLRTSQQQRVWTMFIIIGLLIFPFMSSRGAVDIATLTLIYVMLGLGLNVVVGLAGLLDLGYVGFYAVGAYTYALLNMYFGVSFWVALPIAGGLAALFGFLLGFPVLRLR
ncbi:MAG: DUF3382 domain-containing protein, partial [Oceanospirillum sp.]|nr:DUF3382 domain-containing protein [Oceanospirillum sp.]